MKILQIIPQLRLGGAERLVVNLCNTFVDKGHEVTLAVFEDLDDPQNGFYLADVDKRVKIVSFTKKPGLDTSIFLKTERLIKSVNPDVVHCHLRALAYTAPSAIKFRNIRFVYTLHSDAGYVQYGKLSRLYRLMEYHLYKHRLVIPVTISQESDRSFSKLHGKNIPRALIYNGSPDFKGNKEIPQEFVEAKSAGKKILVNVSRIIPLKNHKALIEAVRDMNDIQLFIIGSATTEYASEILTNLPSNVAYLGTKRNPLTYMANADAFILPSTLEGMPISLIEAFAAGTIPLVTPVGGMINMVTDGLNGLVSRDCSAESIRQMIRRFTSLGDDELAVIRENSRRSFTDYSIERCADRYLALFSKGHDT